MINGLEKGSSGTIYIPTTQNLKISNNDIVVEGIQNLSLKAIKNKTVDYINKLKVRNMACFNKDTIQNEFYSIYKDKQIQKFRIVSIDDNRKGGLQHYKLGVGE